MKIGDVQIYIISRTPNSIFPEALSITLSLKGCCAAISKGYKDIQSEELKSKNFISILLWSSEDHTQIINYIRKWSELQIRTVVIAPLYINKSQIQAIVKAGKTAIIEMEASIDELIHYIHQSIYTNGHGWVLSPGMVAALMDELLHPKSEPSKLRQLSESEMSIVQLAQKGYSLVDTARQLNLSKNTIAAYRSKILKKTNFKSFSQLVASQTA